MYVTVAADVDIRAEQGRVTVRSIVYITIGCQLDEARAFAGEHRQIPYLWCLFHACLYNLYYNLLEIKLYAYLPTNLNNPGWNFVMLSQATPLISCTFIVLCGLLY